MIELATNTVIAGLKLPPFSQLGIAVRDMEAAMRRYSSCYHVDTWYRRSFRGSDYETVYRGQKIVMDLEVAFFYSGRLPVALLQASSEPNMFTEFMDKSGEGFHHFTHLVRNIDHYQQRAQQMGLEVIQTGTVKDGPMLTRFAVLDTSDQVGYLIEVQEVTFWGVFHLNFSKFMTRLGCLSGALQRVPPPVS